MGEKKEDNGETLYSIDENADPEIASTFRETYQSVTEKQESENYALPAEDISAEEQYRQSLEKKAKQEKAKAEKVKKRAERKKGLARAAVAISEHGDEILGLLERVMLLAVAELFRRGSWITAVMLCVLTLLAWRAKIRKTEPGPVVSFFRKDAGEMKTELVRMSKTEYWSRGE